MMDHPVSKAAQQLVDALKPYISMGSVTDSGKIVVEIDVRHGKTKGVRLRDTQLAQFTVRMDTRVAGVETKDKKLVDLEPVRPVESALEG